MQQWDLEGLVVEGLYMGDIPVKGKVELSRIKYGGAVSHHVQLAETIEIYGAERDRVILEHKEILIIHSRDLK